MCTSTNAAVVADTHRHATDGNEIYRRNALCNVSKTRTADDHKMFSFYFDFHINSKWQEICSFGGYSWPKLCLYSSLCFLFLRKRCVYAALCGTFISIQIIFLTIKQHFIPSSRLFFCTFAFYFGFALFGWQSTFWIIFDGCTGVLSAVLSTHVLTAEYSFFIRCRRRRAKNRTKCQKITNRIRDRTRNQKRDSTKLLAMPPPSVLVFSFSSSSFSFLFSLPESVRVYVSALLVALSWESSKCSERPLSKLF